MPSGVWTSIVSIMNYTVLPKDVALSQYSTYICNSQVEIISFLNANTLQIVESSPHNVQLRALEGKILPLYIFYGFLVTVNNVPNT